MEATVFTGWIYDHLLPQAEKVKVAHPLMLRAIAAAKRKNDKIDASKIADCLRCDFLQSAIWHRPRSGTAGGRCAIEVCWSSRGNRHRATLAVARKIIAHLQFA
jgi:hypothetical protein